MLYPVHGIKFNPVSKCFVSTAGGDGCVYFWDFVRKNKISTFKFGSQPVTASELCPEGKFFAFGLGYDWAKGIEGIGSVKPKVCVYQMQQKDH